ncbi:maleylpyruvate isomerase family mycothiol-dependent enzyme [Amycolatopsis jiangsuensis]|nr:maleylpyruvate isomerase family mycothiol-dependent enzyme [Amycolatopsis jiangsuensis]
MFPLPATEYLPHLRALTKDFAEEVRAGRLEAVVPSCGEWTRAELVAHLGNVYRWAAKIVRTGDRERTPVPVSGDPARWYEECAAELLEALAGADPDEPCWHFAGSAKTKAFWFRRQVCETAVHLIDAHAARDAVVRLDPLVAADGVDEVLGSFLPRAARFGPAPSLPVPITLRASDFDQSWTLVPGEPPALGDAHAAATVEAPAQDLLMVLWNRSRLDEAGLRITGDAEVARAFLAAKLTP